MDESWRMRMGVPTPSVPRRRSMEDIAATRHSMDARLGPDDFSDVFGGPPRSVLSHKFPADFTRSSSSSSSSSFYEEIFPPAAGSLSKGKTNGGRSLPAFRIPARGDGFYSDVFRLSDEGRRSRQRSRANSKSKSNSSSVLSSEDLSPQRRPVTGDDVALSSFASKLRFRDPGLSAYLTDGTQPQGRPREQPAVRQFNLPSFPFNHTETCYLGNEDINEKVGGCSSYFKVSQVVSSPETISLEPYSHRSIRTSVDDLELNSPSSPVSSLCHEPEAKAGAQCYNILIEEEQDQVEDEDEVMSSYVIEINSGKDRHREGTDEAVSIDEAIAWAREKFRSRSTDRQHENVLMDHHSDEAEEKRDVPGFAGHQMDGNGSKQCTLEEELLQKSRREEVEKSEKDMAMELMDEDIRLWSAGKETNIRLLLSTLHHILWANSGWYAIALTSLMESSQVKKAYQKARLCLHPDKLQQRGGTPAQKYVAEKVFSILQDAWASFISQDLLFV
ncbi:AUXILIN/CYCLIN G-ASSOCIATED KINASE-RELATED [Salix koriyanagi]|uniref:AUXILIN/CYCLIN G-ASSOCIATED KINASE-RELATED n=1 Tax=Salix koriyanagi TaxID=2511006 RepID=A0A9Q0ZBI3_9ROSI|nr:AUXILIN/CYCLIN G-ASSOCIATED KINASE-RELATED [Salix koriyanagi]